MANRNQDVDDDAFEGLRGEQQNDVANRTNALLDGPNDDASAVAAADSVMRLAKALPKLEDIVEVGEEDTSPLTEKELEQKSKTEEVILAANAAGKAAIWVMGQGLAAASLGKWYRDTHPNLEAYVADLVPDVVPRQARRWVTGSKLALAVTARTGEAPVEGQIRELTRAKGKGKEKTVLPHEVAEDMYIAAANVASETGQKVTAKVLEEFRNVVEGATVLPGDEEERQVTLQEWVRPLLTGPIGPDSADNDADSDGDGAGGEGSNDDVHDAEVVETPQLDALDQALADLKAARKTIKRTTFETAIDEGDHARYHQLVQQLRTLTAELKGATDRAPWPTAPVPAQGDSPDTEQQPEEATV
ncbi:hypothetical protein [Streptomyces mobaraensis]|uniref:Uncharacterized protein n=1 Tax=Streptomyces mobaraensis TaxID=35621 RepID=A0A5N5VXL0_STRMB|nr:hypothetical protein [Streptomyces mobaraensis]KAB7833544.1 hypothetical protein FRZ00_33400 [Streptomyces mobaraensis]